MTTVMDVNKKWLITQANNVVIIENMEILMEKLKERNFKLISSYTKYKTSWACL